MNDYARPGLGRLNRTLNGLFNRLGPRPPRLLSSFVDEAFQALKVDLRLRGVAAYAERREGFELWKRLGEGVAGAPDEVGPRCPAVGLALRHRVYVFADPREEGGPAHAGLLPALPAAAMVVGRRPHRHVLFFVLDDGWVWENVDFALNVLRAALGLQLLEERVGLDFRQAAEIQESLLQEPPPSLAGFDVAFRSIPAEEIGGDFCDFVRFDGELAGFAVGDASGHGLPAALLVRDVVTGLRMGLEKHLRMEYVFAKLNRVIHRSNPSSRYVSVFYGELESNGNLAYLNAGHQPPLLFRPDRVLELRRGGTVIGPFEAVPFRRGFVTLDPGSLLVVFTDGLVERRDAHDEFYGEDRVKRVVRESPGFEAQALVERLIEDSRAFGGGRPWEDDVTVLVVRRVEGARTR